jgi:hypothetical protein
MSKTYFTAVFAAAALLAVGFIVAANAGIDFVWRG